MLRYSDNNVDEEQLAEQEQPYGFGRFGQVGLNATFAVDRRDNPQYPRKGVFFATRATLWPEVWDTEDLREPRREPRSLHVRVASG